jgi:hypothetical protein
MTISAAATWRKQFGGQPDRIPDRGNEQTDEDK